jgi:hypothetical protein
LKQKGEQDCYSKKIEDYKRLDQEIEKHCCHKTQRQQNEEAQAQTRRK